MERPLVPLTLIYDGDCGFCRESMTWFHRITRKPVRAVPAFEIRSALKSEEAIRAEEEILFVDAEGRVLGGVPAISAALAAGGRPVLAWLLAHTPFAPAAYRWIAARRRSISCRVAPRQSPSPPREPAPPGRAQS